jgi:alkanesulfonate monooxygenase SsuD/methylene tetrahydromethanopterin reductase-like flavin-dependent oxidoreductase (luciferase family)
MGINAYVADSKAQAVKENGPYFLYFNRTLFSHGNFTETSIGQAQGYMSKASIDYVRPENLHEAERARQDFRNMTMDDVARMAERLAWGTPQEVTERIIAAVDRAGANTIQVMFNAGALPQEMYLEQIRRFARDVLPALQAHQVTRVPVAEEAVA